MLHGSYWQTKASGHELCGEIKITLNVFGVQMFGKMKLLILIQEVVGVIAGGWASGEIN